MCVCRPTRIASEMELGQKRNLKMWDVLLETGALWDWKSKRHVTSYTESLSKHTTNFLNLMD